MAAEEQIAVLTEIVRTQQVLQQQMNEQNHLREQNDNLAHPTYSAKNEEDMFDFIEVVNREAVAGGWDDNGKLRLAKGALRGIAAEWRWQHDLRLEWTPTDWNGWSTALCTAFRKRYSFAEWEKLVTAHVQRKDESAPQYALSKAKLRRHCPYQITEADFIPYLIQWIHF